MQQGRRLDCRVVGLDAFWVIKIRTLTETLAQGTLGLTNDILLELLSSAIDA